MMIYYFLLICVDMVGGIMGGEVGEDESWVHVERGGGEHIDGACSQ